jgi:hypothetical protein
LDVHGDWVSYGRLAAGKIIGVTDLPHVTNKKNGFEQSGEPSPLE